MGYDYSGDNWVYYNLSSTYSPVTSTINLTVSLNPVSTNIIEDLGGVYIILR